MSCNCMQSWQWFQWRWPRFRHQFTTESLWRPGFVQFRNMAWQPDVAGWTTARFAYDLNKWAGDRGVPAQKAVVDLNTGSQAFF